MELSNREWAYLAWLVAFIGYALIKDKKRLLAEGIRRDHQEFCVKGG